MKPESEWFRPPKLKECSGRGDTQRFLWVAEPELHGGIWGVGYEVAETICAVNGDGVLDKIHAAAKEELYRRIGDPIHAHEEGCMLDDFLWVPVLRRLGDGTVEVLHGSS